MSENENFEARKNRIIRTLSTMFDFLGLTGDFRIEMRGTRIGVKIASEEAGRIIGRKGQTLESLQLILNRILFKDDKEFPMVMLDIDGYARGERPDRNGGGADSSSSGNHSSRPESAGPRGGHRRSERFEEGGGMTAKEQLEQQALDAAKEVKRWGDPIKMPEMNAHDRRIIHLALQDDADITTESEGDGSMRQVVIALKSKAE